jgi:V/A-type H+-transporting ATPase subunit I
MIVKMLHLDLVCLSAEKEKTLTQLRDLGAVHLDLSSAQGATVAAAKGEAADAEKAVRLILKARGRTKDCDIHERSVADILAIDSDREKLKVAKDELERQVREYERYGDFDPELAAKLLKEVEGIRDVVGLPETLPEMRLSKMYEKLERVENRISIDEAKLAGSDEKAILRRYPVLADRIAFESAKELVGESGELAFVSGWVPEMRRGELGEAARANGWATLLREPADGETPPTLLEPPKMFRPMKALFDGLGIAPAYTEADVSVPFMCYFSLFFAMLVGDGAYGAIFLAGTLAMRKKLPKSWFILLTVFSSATIAWGVLSNTWFGAAIPWCADWPTVKWLGDVTYRNIMLVCFTIGASHLMLARIWNGVCRLPDSTAVAEFGWAGVLLFMYFVTNSLVGIFPSIPSCMTWVFGVSLVCVFLFSVKPKDLKKDGISLGMLPLNIMSSLGDIISYVRLFAVGLASVKVAENFNSMALGLVSGDKPLWLNALMFVGTVLILVAGHALNLAMAALSILVHAVRLNTLEFSNHKGVSWSGYAFRPFRKNNN